MNETLMSIRNRRSVRKYKDEQIKDEELNAILEAGQYAPSAMNQGKVWKVVTDESTFNILRERFTVGNILRSENGLEMKIVAEEKPIETAMPLQPTLEDFYIEHFGEEVRNDGTVQARAL